MMPDSQDASLPDALAVPLSGDLPPAPPADRGRADSRHGPELDVAVPAPVKDAIAAALAHHAYASRGAYAANTERAFRADTAIFTGWCAAAGFASLPAEPGIVAAFVDAMGDAKAPATIRRYVASIAACHRAARLPNPCGDDTVRLALKRLHRAKGRAQAQAAPLTRDRVEIMLAAGGDGPRALRNRALLAVAYDSLCRRSELVVLGCGDVQAGPHDDGTLTLRRSKTDQEGQGSIRYLAPDTMRAVRAWMDAAGHGEGALFRSVGKGGAIGGPLDTGDVARIFKSMARAAGLDASIVAAISGHSSRVGAAQDQVRHGVELPAVMQAGGWTTPAMVARYSARLEARRSGAAKLAVMQNRG
jgi:integrase